MDRLYIEEYCNMEIYPLMGILEREAGLMSELAEAFLTENKSLNYKLYTDHSKFIEDNLFNFDTTSPFIITYTNFLTDNFTDIVLSPQNEFMDNHFCKKVKFMDKILYLSSLASEIFQKHFWYYFDTLGSFVYNNLICCSIPSANAQKSF